MDLPPGRRLRPSSLPPHGYSLRCMDLISALPDEMLLLVLARLRCIRSAVQTSLLSRRWRGLWNGLTDLAFRGLVPARIVALFRRFAGSPVSTLDINLPWKWNYDNHTTAANSLLHAAVPLSPGHLIFTLEERYSGIVELPYFPCTTSIKVDTKHLWVNPPRAGEFTALKSLCVTGKIVNLGSLINRCPHLRILSLTCPEEYRLQVTLPPALTLEKLSLSGKIVDLDSLLSRCQRLRVLSITQLDTCLLRIMLPLSGEFPMLEKLTLSGNIADLGILLNGCPRLHILSVTFRGTSLRSPKEALTALEKATKLNLVLSTISIKIPWRDGITEANFAYLLGTMEKLSPQKLLVTETFEGSQYTHNNQIKANLPCFARATSVEISLRNICFKSLPAGELSMLKSLSLSRLCSSVDIGTLVNRCPHLHVLKVTISNGKITVHSASLQKLDLDMYGGTECQVINIITPVLKKLQVKVHVGWDIGVSISAPMLENVSWQCSYKPALMFSSWCLRSLRVRTIEMSYVMKREGTCSFKQIVPPYHIMCLHLTADKQFDAELNMEQEVEKLLVKTSLCWRLPLNPLGMLTEQCVATPWTVSNLCRYTKT